MPLAPGNYGGEDFTAGQLAIAQIIANVGYGMGASDRDVAIGIMTGITESGLRNLHHGDRDSQGVFQQRPSQGWGTVAQVTNPRYASRKFFEALLKIGNRDSLQPWIAAQRVQRSAFPSGSNYRPHWPASQAVVAAMGGDPGPVEAQPTGALGGLGEALQVITDPAMWYRVGLFLLGVVLLLVGAVLLMGGQLPIGRIAEIAGEVGKGKRG